MCHSYLAQMPRWPSRGVTCPPPLYAEGKQIRRSGGLARQCIFAQILQFRSRSLMSNWPQKLLQLIMRIWPYGRGSACIHPRHGNAERKPNNQTNSDLVIHPEVLNGEYQLLSNMGIFPQAGARPMTTTFYFFHFLFLNCVSAPFPKAHRATENPPSHGEHLHLNI